MAQFLTVSCKCTLAGRGRSQFFYEFFCWTREGVGGWLIWQF